VCFMINVNCHLIIWIIKHMFCASGVNSMDMVLFLSQILSDGVVSLTKMCQMRSSCYLRTVTHSLVCNTYTFISNINVLKTVCSCNEAFIFNIMDEVSPGSKVSRCQRLRFRNAFF
jgi:hypothetical protein